MRIGMDIGTPLGTLIGPRVASRAGKTIVIVGDSTAAGRGIAERCDPGLGLTSAYAAVKMSAKIGIANDPITWSFDLNKRDLQPYTTGATPSMGIELTLGRQLYQRGFFTGTTTPFVGKFALNSATLAGHYKPDGTYPTNPGPPNLFAQLQTYIDGAIADAGEPLGTLIVFLGTNDAATQVYADALATNLDGFITPLRARYGSFRLVLIRISANCTQTYAANAIAQQDLYASTATNTVLINTDDLPLSDGLHMDAAETAALGYRVAEAILADAEIADVEMTDYIGYLGAAPAGVGAGAVSAPVFPHRAGDVLYLVGLNANTNTVPSLSSTWGTLVTTHQSSVDLSGLKYQNIAIWERVVTQADLDASTSGQIPPPTLADGGTINAARVFVFRPPTPASTSRVDAIVKGQNNNYTNPISAASGTTTVNKVLVVYFPSSWTSGNNTVGTLTNASLTDITEHQDSYYAVSGDREILGCVSGKKATAGAFNAMSGAFSNVGINATIGLALKP